MRTKTRQSAIMPEQPEPMKPPQTDTKGWLKKLTHHPLFGIIIGAIIAAYFYAASIREPNLTYYISPTRAAFVQKGNLTNFSVNYQGAAVTGDLSSAEIQIWNKGKAPIHKSDILKRITLSTPNGEPFYTEIYTNTRKDIVGFEFLETN